MKPSQTGDSNFDYVARCYRWMEYITFGRSLERCRNHFLPRLSGCRRSLVLGDGDGRFLARLFASNRRVCADSVDSSSSMLRLQELRCNAGGNDARVRLRIHPANALDFKPAGSYDLIVSHFFLDCFAQVQIERLCSTIAPHLHAQAIWLVSDFRIPAGPMEWPARVIVRVLYFAFRLLTGLRIIRLPDHAAALDAAGFTRIAQHLSLGGLLTSELWEYTPAMLPPQRSRIASIPDPVPDPEPASPSLPEPDPGVFHHEPGSAAAKSETDAALADE